jgi:hypothetical protein
MLIYNTIKRDSNPSFSENGLFIKAKDLNFSNNHRVSMSKDMNKGNFRKTKFFELKMQLEKDYLSSHNAKIKKHKSAKSNDPVAAQSSRKENNNKIVVFKNIENQNEDNEKSNEVKETQTPFEAEIKGEIQNSLNNLLKSMGQSYLLTGTKFHMNDTKSSMNSYNKTTYINTNKSKQATGDYKVNRDHYLQKINYLTKSIWEEEYNKDLNEAQIVLPKLTSPSFNPQKTLNFKKDNKIKQDHKFEYNCLNHRKIYCCHDSLFSDILN